MWVSKSCQSGGRGYPSRTPGPPEILCALLRQRGSCSLCWRWRPPRRTLCRASELPGGRVYASRNSWKSWLPPLRQRNTRVLVLTMEACENLSTQDKVSDWTPPSRTRWLTTIRLVLLAVNHFMAATAHHIEDVMATCHPPGVAAEATHPTPIGLPTALEEIRCGTSPAVCL